MPDHPILDQVNLVVRDLPAAVDFYRRLGLVIPDRGPWDTYHRSAESTGPIDFDLDSTEFATKWNEGSSGTAVTLGFKVSSRDEVDRLFAELTGAGNKGQQSPYDAFWGARYAIVEDPDGNPVGIMSPIDADRRTAPPM
jgi:catechol 2,3-dioxygenase-like lactoylglutathione lyase family enzyme